MPQIFFVSDLHGKPDRYHKLFHKIKTEKPNAVLIGGDILPNEILLKKSINILHQDFINDFLVPELKKLKNLLKKDYPKIFIIMGNDDARFEESSLLSAATEGVWEYIHNRQINLGQYQIYGYAYIPPTPFRLKDWERYDVSRYTDPGCIPLEEGHYSIPVSIEKEKYQTIEKDLTGLTKHADLQNSIFLFHTPPYKTHLDRAALDGQMVDHCPLDVHVGSIAVRKFIEKQQPKITLHGHIHESARITGSWMDWIGKTVMFTAAHDGPELALVRFDPEKLPDAKRELI